MIRRFLLWLAFNVPLGRLNPWLLGLAIGRKPIDMNDNKRRADDGE